MKTKESVVSAKSVLVGERFYRYLSYIKNAPLKKTLKCVFRPVFGFDKCPLKSSGTAVDLPHFERRAA